jgi:hypothetical protein
LWREINRRSWWDKGALAFWNRKNPQTGISYGAKLRRVDAKVDDILDIVTELAKRQGFQARTLTLAATAPDSDEHFDNEEFEPEDDVSEDDDE